MHYRRAAAARKNRSHRQALHDIGQKMPLVAARLANARGFGVN
jgi:hypothetical protein